MGATHKNCESRNGTVWEICEYSTWFSSTCHRVWQKNRVRLDMITDSSAHEEKEEEEDRTPARFWRSQKNCRKHLSASLQRQSRSREHWIFLLKQRIARNYRLPSPSPPRCAALPCHCTRIRDRSGGGYLKWHRNPRRYQSGYKDS